MGGCHAKPLTHDADHSPPPAAPATPPPAPATPAAKKHWTSSPFFPFSTPSPSPAHHLFSSSAAASPRTTRNTPSKSPAPASTTPARRLLRLPFPPPSPAKHIRQALARRHGPSRPAIPEEGGDGESGRGLDKGFGFNKGFAAKYEMGDEVGRGHFGYTCAARIRKGSRKGEAVAVKVIPKAKVMQLLQVFAFRSFFFLRDRSSDNTRSLQNKRKIKGKGTNDLQSLEVAVDEEDVPRRAAAAPPLQPWIGRSPQADGKSRELGSKEPPPRIVVVALDLDAITFTVDVVNPDSPHHELREGEEVQHSSTEPRAPRGKQIRGRAPRSTTTREDLRLHKTPIRPRHPLPDAAGGQTTQP